jgi:DNA-binding response OmpR family regulator
MQKPNILIVEDDLSLNEQIADLLLHSGFHVEQCHDGESGLAMASRGCYDLILLDVTMPKRDGFSLLNILRKHHQTPVIMVTAKGAEEERIKGFREGADDYLAKPFNSTELLLRIEALLRRSRTEPPANQSAQLDLDGLHINRFTQSVQVNQHPVELTPIQFNLLWELVLNCGEVLSKPYLYQTVLNRSYGIYDRSLDMHLSRVRRKLNEAKWEGDRLQTVHGKGYCIK